MRTDILIYSKDGERMKVLWIITAIMALVGAFFIAIVFAIADSSQKETAGAVIAMAFAIVPFVFTSAVEKIVRSS